MPRRGQGPLNEARGVKGPCYIRTKVPADEGWTVSVLSYLDATQVWPLTQRNDRPGAPRIQRKTRYIRLHQRERFSAESAGICYFLPHLRYFRPACLKLD